MTDMKPLAHGNILIVGTKASNFDEEIRTNPRVILWDGQHENWVRKDIPQNVQAIFFTRFIGHNAFGKIVAEARKKHLTVFNPLGTGTIARQVKELLGSVEPVQKFEIETKKEVETMTTTKVTGYGKLPVFIPFIDFTLNNRANAKILMEKAKELGVESTPDSLANFVGAYRRKMNHSSHRRTRVKTETVKTVQTIDTSVEMLDNMIKDLTDMRAYLIETTRENKALKAKLDKFKKVFNE
jgi:hypothetical protein